MLNEWHPGSGAGLCSRLTDVRWLALLVFVPALTVGVEADTPLLAVARVGSALTVTFDLLPTRTDDLAARLRAGEPVSVKWDLDVRREVAFWIDRGAEQFALKVIARPTADPGVFVIERTMNRRELGTPALASLEETYRHLTSFANVELPYAAPPAVGPPYRLAIRASVEGGGEATISTPELARALIER